MLTSLVMIACLYGTSPDAQFVVQPGFHRGQRTTVLARPVGITDRSGKAVYLRHDAAGAFDELVAYAAREGIQIRVNYGFRTHEQQRELRRHSRRLAAMAGHSDHQRGISVDLAGTSKRTKHGYRKTALYYWLKREAPRFGFVNDLKKESWHFTFQGAPVTVSHGNDHHLQS